MGHSRAAHGYGRRAGHVDGGHGFSEPCTDAPDASGEARSRGAGLHDPRTEVLRDYPELAAAPLWMGTGQRFDPLLSAGRNSCRLHARRAAHKAGGCGLRFYAELRFAVRGCGIHGPAPGDRTIVLQYAGAFKVRGLENGPGRLRKGGCRKRHSSCAVLLAAQSGRPRLDGRRAVGICGGLSASRHLRDLRRGPLRYRPSGGQTHSYGERAGHGRPQRHADEPEQEL